MKLPLKGIIPPMITPLLENNELDINGLNNLIEHILEGGVHGVFLLGTNGEGASLGYSLRKQLVKEACNIVNGRVPVLVSITDTSLESTLEIANYAKKVGADALVVAPPFYFPISQEEMMVYIQNLAPLLPLPFLMYNIPSCTKLHLSLETIKYAKELGAIGIKDSSGDMASLYAIMEEFKDSPDFSVIAGSELFLSDTIMYGGHGVVAGGANVLPRLFVDFYDACLSNDLNRIKMLHQQILKLHNTIYTVGDSSTRSIKAIKCALSIMGVCNDNMAQPLSKLDDGQRNQIKDYLNQFEYSKNYMSVL